MRFFGVCIAIWTLLFHMGLVSAMSYEEAISSLSRDGLLHLTDKNYRKLVKNDNFALVVYLTAEDPRVGCTLCQDFTPKYKGVAYKYYTSFLSNPELNKVDAVDDKERVIFAISDFVDAREYFQNLELTAVPRLFYYEPGKGPELAKFTNEFSFMVAENANTFTRWIANNVPGLNLSDLHYEPSVPISTILISLLTVLLIAYGIYKFRDIIIPFIQSKKIWQFFSFTMIILLISGHMYNQIRGTEMFRTDKETGKIQYFAVGHNAQFGAETQILGIVYGILSISFIGLIKFIPNLKDPKAKLVGTIIACVISFVAYSYIISAYRVKSPSYPFSLLNMLI